MLVLQDLRYIQVFRCLRLLRLFRLGRYFKSIRLVVHAIWKSLPDLTKVMVLLGILSYTSALFGKGLFAYRAILDEEDNLIYDPAEI